MATPERPPVDETPSAEPIRVVHVCGGTRTGCTRVVLNLLAHHDRARFEPAVCFFSIAPAEREVLDRAEALGVPVREVVKRSSHEASAVPRLGRALRALSAEIVVLHGFGAYSFGAMAARVAEIPVRVRVEHSPELYTPLQRVASASMARLVDSTILVSASLGDYLRAHGTTPPHPEVIYNGIDLATFEQVSRAPFSQRPGGAPPVAFMAGRLDGAKDHESLLEAIAILAGRDVAIELRLAGTGPFEASLRARAKALGIEARVTFLGWRDDLAACLEDTDVGVLSTHYEGFGLAVVEAMAAGRPVLATRVASLPELVEDGRQGILVGPRDPMALAGALERLIARPDEARAMGEAGRRRAHERFALLPSVRAFERHLAASAAKKGVPSRARDRSQRLAAAPSHALSPLERSPRGPSLIRVPDEAPASPAMATRDRIRVLHVINDLGLAGAEQVVLNLVGNRRADVDCTVARLNEVGELDAGIRAAGGEVVALHLEGMLDLAGGAKRLAGLIRKLRPHVVHTHLLHAEILGGALGRSLFVPAVVGTVHNVLWDDAAYYNPILRAVYRSTVRANDHTVAVVDAARKLLLAAGVAPDRVSTIPNGIPDVPRLPRMEARRLLGLPPPPAGRTDERFVIGAIGNLYLYKGHDLLLSAAARLLAERTDLEIVILGEGERRRALMQQARDLGLGDRLHMPGRLPGAAALLDAFDVYAQPSRTEGASIALLEAMAAGRACVASTAGGTPDFVGQSGAALLIPPDDEEALTSALASLIRDPEHRTALAARARRHASRFTARAMTESYEHLYFRLLGRDPATDLATAEAIARAVP